MQLNKIARTCSMVELGDMSSLAFNMFRNKQSLIDTINDRCRNIDWYFQPKVAIFNCKFSFWNRLKLFLKFGFHWSYSYKGENGRVYVMFLKLN